MNFSKYFVLAKFFGYFEYLEIQKIQNIQNIFVLAKYNELLPKVSLNLFLGDFIIF